MTAFLIYVLKSALVLALLVSLFMIFMSRETFHRVNRYIMLSIVSIALLLPAVNLGIESPFNGLGDAIEEYFAAEEPLLAADTCSMPVYMAAFDELPVLPEAPLGAPSVITPVEEEPFNWLLLAAVVYFAGVALLVVRQVVMYVQVARMIACGRVVDASMYGCKGISLRVHRGKEKPFSWFRWVVVSEDDLGEGAREILIHETAHAHAGHSWDIVLADAVIIMQWFNPLAWIMKNSLKDIHEFEADYAVINSGVNAKQYQLLIIKKAVGARLYSIANSFNHSLTKKRITMMCKEKSKKWRCAKALYIVPVVAIAACSLSTQENNDADSVSKDNEFIVTNSFLQIDTARLNTAYRELMKRPSDKKCQEAFFDAFPANWDEFITTYGYFPQDGYDLTMYYLAYEHIKALGDCSASIDSVAYCRKLVNIAVGGIFQADAPSHFQSLLHRVMWERMDAMLDYISQLRRGYQMRFWQFYWSSIVPHKKSEDEYARLYERNSREYPEEMNIMKIAFEYFHNGVNIHGSYIE